MIEQEAWKWRTARVIQFHNDVPADHSDNSRDEVRVRFVDKYIESRKGWYGGDGHDTERTVTWADREIKLYHTEQYKRAREAIEQLISSISSSSSSGSSSSSSSNRPSEGPTAASNDEGGSDNDNGDTPNGPDPTTAAAASGDATQSMNESMAFSEKTLILSGLRELDGMEELQVTPLSLMH